MAGSQRKHTMVARKTRGKKTGSRRRSKRAAASRSQASARSKRPVIGGALAVLALATVGTAGYLTWQRSHRPPIAIPDGLEQLSPELVTLINRQVDAVKAEPRSAVQHATLGLVYEANSCWPQARACFQTATALQGDEPLWPYHAAIALRRAGDSQGALAWLRRYGTRFPGFAPLQQDLGNALLQAGAVEDAEAAFRRTIAAAPSEADGYVGLGEVKLRQGDYGQAAKLLEQAVQRDPQYKTARYLLGMA